VDCAFGGGVAALSHSRRNYSAQPPRFARWSWLSRRHAFPGLEFLRPPYCPDFGSGWRGSSRAQAGDRQSLEGARCRLFLHSACRGL